jgi:hypothetical protein
LQGRQCANHGGGDCHSGIFNKGEVMKTEDVLILGVAAAAVFVMVKFVTGKGGSSGYGFSTKNLLGQSALSAYDPYGGMQAVTDVERPLFSAAGMGSMPTMQQQMDYYYKDGF